MVNQPVARLGIGSPRPPDELKDVSLYYREEIECYRFTSMRKRLLKQL